nr:DUF255 domain-containing protein [Clostridium akagii]
MNPKPHKILSYNSVDWYSWNDEAFAKAKVEDKPIFLSIGYSLMGAVDYLSLVAF